MAATARPGTPIPTFSGPTDGGSLGIGEILPRYLYLEPLVLGRRILEVGLVAASGGAGARFLAERGARSVLALDPDPEAIQAARQSARTGVDFVCGTLGEVPERAFDLALVSLERAPERARAFLDSVMSRLSPGGYLVAALRNPAGVSLAQVARGDEKEAPATYAEVAEALAVRFPSVEVAAQTVLLGYRLGPMDSDTGPVLDDSLGSAREPAYFLFICGAQPSELGEQLLATVPPAPIAVASAAREELREMLIAAERRSGVLLAERAVTEQRVDSDAEVIAQLEVRLGAAEKLEVLLRSQLESSEDRVTQAEARAQEATRETASLEVALKEAVGQGTLLRTGLDAAAAERTAAIEARAEAESRQRFVEAERDAIAAERERLVELRAEAQNEAAARGAKQSEVEALLAKREGELAGVRESAQAWAAQVDELSTTLQASRREAQAVLADRAALLASLEKERSEAKEAATRAELLAAEAAAHARAEHDSMAERLAQVESTRLGLVAQLAELTARLDASEKARAEDEERLNEESAKAEEERARHDQELEHAGAEAVAKEERWKQEKARLAEGHEAAIEGVRAELTEAQRESEQALEAAREAHRGEVATLREEAQRELEAERAARHSHEAQLERVAQQAAEAHQAELAEVWRLASETEAGLKEAHRAGEEQLRSELEEQRATHAAERVEAEAQHRSAVDLLRADAELTRQDHLSALAKGSEGHSARVEALQREHQGAVEELRAAHAGALAEGRAQVEALQAELESERDARHASDEAHVAALERAHLESEQRLEQSRRAQAEGEARAARDAAELRSGIENERQRSEEHARGHREQRASLEQALEEARRSHGDEVGRLNREASAVASARAEQIAGLEARLTEDRAGHEAKAQALREARAAAERDHADRHQALQIEVEQERASRVEEVRALQDSAQRAADQAARELTEARGAAEEERAGRVQHVAELEARAEGIRDTLAATVERAERAEDHVARLAASLEAVEQTNRAQLGALELQVGELRAERDAAIARGPQLEVALRQRELELQGQLESEQREGSALRAELEGRLARMSDEHARAVAEWQRQHAAHLDEAGDELRSEATRGHTERKALEGRINELRTMLEAHQQAHHESLISLEQQTAQARTEHERQLNEERATAAAQLQAATESLHEQQRAHADQIVQLEAQLASAELAKRDVSDRGDGQVRDLEAALVAAQAGAETAIAAVAARESELRIRVAEVGGERDRYASALEEASSGQIRVEQELGEVRAQLGEVTADLHRQIEEAATNEAQLTAQLKEVQDEVNLAREERGEWGRTRVELARATGALKSAQAEREILAQVTSTEADGLRRRIAELESRLQQAQAQFAERTSMQTLTSRDRDDKLTALSSQVDQMRTAAREAAQAHEAALAGARTEGERWRLRAESTTQQLSSTQGMSENRLKALQAELGGAHEQMKTDGERLLRTIAQRDEATRTAELMRSRLGTLEADVKQLGKTKTDLEDKLRSVSGELQATQSRPLPTTKTLALEQRVAALTAELSQARAQMASLEGARLEALGSTEARARISALEQEVAELARTREEAERATLAERQRAASLEARLASAVPPTELQFQLKATEMREQALQADRARLQANLEEEQRLQRATEIERLRLEAEVGTTESVRASLASKEALLEATQSELSEAHVEVEALKKRLGMEETHRAEHLVKATAKAGQEAKMLRELSERQSGELKELRVQWARGSAELNRVRTAHESLQQAELAARTELQSLKEGKGMLSAADVAEAMGVDLAHVQRLEQRIRELESALRTAEGK